MFINNALFLCRVILRKDQVNIPKLCVINMQPKLGCYSDPVYKLSNLVGKL